MTPNLRAWGSRMSDFMYRDAHDMSFCGWCGKAFPSPEPKRIKAVVRRVQTSPKVVNVTVERWCEDCEYPPEQFHVEPSDE